ncbi:MAG: class I SAM-dependent methyltransferase [Gemmatimonadales bacterium]
MEEAGYDFVKLIEVKSEFALPRLVQEREGRFDFVFIDGWPTFDHAMLDAFCATRLLRVGGYLVLDDVSFPSIRRVADFLGKYPCYQSDRSVSRTRPRSWKNVLVQSLMRPVSRRVWGEALSRTLYRRIFEDRFSRMVAFKKIGEDARPSLWHNDAF